MFFCHKRRLIYAVLLLSIAVRGAEDNYWPFLVRYTNDATGTNTDNYLGPLVFSQSDSQKLYGLRPLFLESQAEGSTQGSMLYPFFTWRREGEYQSFSFFQLVNSRSDEEDAVQPDHRLDVWPFYFSRDAADSYRAFFPLGGTIKNRFGKDRITFFLFPLYAHTAKNERQVTHAPWPFLRFIAGAGHHGFEFWPLFGRSGRNEDYDRQFYLWPLIYKSVTNLSEETPDAKIGALPFYTRDTGPGYISETYAWPFFGYAHRTMPYRYDEQRYFWPFLVQGRGDERRVNRWAPFYTHSVIKGSDKTWLVWPLYRNQRWQADGVAQQKNQFLFFLYWSLTQQSLANSAAAPANKTHLWPLISSWDNGAGQRQVQAPSPFEVFFPGNDTVRQLWSPLFALYRYDRQSDTTVRHSLLWNAVTYRHGPLTSEFHLGPLLSVQTDNTRSRLALGNGVIGLQRRTGERWRFFLFDFLPKPAINANLATP